MDFKIEVEKRVEWIKKVIADSHTNGVVYGNSGGKDSALVGILVKMATNNVTSIIMPCDSKRNYSIDRDHALLMSRTYDINTIEIDLTEAKKVMKSLILPHAGDKVDMAYHNINPRLRMITLYTYAQSNNLLVAGTGNLSEATMGYFTKWGDGACDFNPVADMTATEIIQMLEYLDCPKEITEKAPSAGLYEGQTDEKDMGITYKDLDDYLRGKTEKNKEKIESVKAKTAHKRTMPRTYPN